MSKSSLLGWFSRNSIPSFKSFKLFKSWMSGQGGDSSAGRLSPAALAVVLVIVFGFAFAPARVMPSLRADAPDSIEASPGDLDARDARDTRQQSRAIAAAAADTAVSNPNKFLRFVDNGRSGGRLETGIVTYRNKDGVTVSLVAAIHIGEKSYFQDLNKTFEKYDAVLYELVKPKDVEIPVPNVTQQGGGTNPISELQHFMKDSLNLDFQLDDIDYSKPNFIHADMDRETFEKMQAQRGESFEMMMFQQVLSAMSKANSGQGDDSPGVSDKDQLKEMLHILTRPDAERQVKLILARQMGDLENASGGLSGAAGTIIVTERNKVCTRVLMKAIEAGKKKIAIFYGAAHMPDLEDRLTLMGFKQVSNEYKQAWDLNIRPDQPSAVEKIIDGLIDSFGDDDAPADNQN